MMDLMTFPNTWEEYEQSYGFTDTEEIYTNKARLIPSFRVEQWLEHIAQPQRMRGKWMAVQDGDDDGFIFARCNVCKWDSGEAFKFAKKIYNFCPHCGADMREGQDGCD